MPKTSILFTQYDFAAGIHLPTHHHSEAQLLFARSGTLDLMSDKQLFILPSSRIAWIPPNVPHSLRFRTATELRTAYIPGLADQVFPRQTSVFQVSELFRALLLRLTEDQSLSNEFQADLERMLLFEMTQLKCERFSLTLPSDPRAMRISEIFLKHPADKRSLNELAQEAACSAKTLTRLFIEETEMTFKLWRRHARLFAGIELLEGGVSITEAAYRVGFSTPSAFSEAFRLTFGYPPSMRTTRL